MYYDFQPRLMRASRSLSNLQHYPPECALVLDSQDAGALFLGNYEAAQSLRLLQQRGIGAVLTVSNEINLSSLYSRAGIANKIISIDDSQSANISQFFQSAFAFIDHHRAFTNVLVHCMAGVSRSSTIVIAYLMQKYSLDLSQAYRHVKAKKSNINPNRGFVEQLRNLEGGRVQPSRVSLDRSRLSVYDGLRRRLSQIEDRYQQVLARRGPLRYLHQSRLRF